MQDRKETREQLKGGSAREEAVPPYTCQRGPLRMKGVSGSRPNRLVDIALSAQGRRDLAIVRHTTHDLTRMITCRRRVGSVCKPWSTQPVAAREGPRGGNRV